MVVSGDIVLVDHFPSSEELKTATFECECVRLIKLSRGNEYDVIMRPCFITHYIRMHLILKVGCILAV